MSPAKQPISIRTAFLSDLHLGSRDCRAELILDFLRSIRTDELILVGDIVDLWSLRRTVYWPSSHSDVLREIASKAWQGTRVRYVPGNHDEQFRRLGGSIFGQVEVHREYVHETRRGLRLLVVHGDEFDAVVTGRRWMSVLGSGLYDVALGLNRSVNGLRRQFGYGYWSLAGYLKERIGNARHYVRRFEEAAAQAARRRGLDGVVCGHIHRPSLENIGGTLYCNDGDWVDSCSALVEHDDGELELWNWAALARQRGRVGASPALASAA